MQDLSEYNKNEKININPAENIKPDWVKIKADYITSSISQKEIARKYGVSENAVSKHCKSENWIELRKKKHEKAAEKIADKINDDKVKKTVKEIDRVVKVAGKLITKLNRAVNELDKREQIISERIVTTANEKEDDENAVVEVKKTIERDREFYKTLVDTKKAEQISKSLLNVKEILSDYSSKQNEDEQLGIVEIPAQADLVHPEFNREGEEVVDDAVE